MPTTPIQADDDAGADDTHIVGAASNNKQPGTIVIDDRMDETRKTVRFEKDDDDQRRHIYRRCRSEDFSSSRTSSLKSSLRANVLRQNSIYNKENSTPLLEAGEDEHADICLSKDTSQTLDEHDGGNLTPKKRRRRRRITYIWRLVVTLVVLGIIVAICSLHIKTPNISSPPKSNEREECQTFEAYLNEEVIKTETKKAEYYLPWKYSNDTSSSLTRIKCNERDFVALKTGRYNINVKIHVNTHHWIGEADLERQFPVKLCLRLGQDSGFQDTDCSVKIQLSKEIGAMSLNHMLTLEEGQKFSFLLRTDEELKNIIGSSQPKINKIQIHKENCKV